MSDASCPSGHVLFSGCYNTEKKIVNVCSTQDKCEGDTLKWINGCLKDTICDTATPTDCITFHSQIKGACRYDQKLHKCVINQCTS